jgi:hypothetical protein
MIPNLQPAQEHTGL